MTFELKVFMRDYDEGQNAWNRMRFAVIDLNKSEDYPENFVSMLPMRINSDNVFTKFFGNKSLETARRLLTKSLKKEHRAEIKAEIERRLNLLEPNTVIDIRCHVCKKFFQTQKEARKQKICPKCLKRFDRKK
jgi:hypothetical protein